MWLEFGASDDVEKPVDVRCICASQISSTWRNYLGLEDCLAELSRHVLGTVQQGGKMRAVGARHFSNGVEFDE